MKMNNGSGQIVKLNRLVTYICSLGMFKKVIYTIFVLSKALSCIINC